MTGKDFYKIWAPIGAKWVDWVRPVPFINIDDNLKLYEVSNFKIPEIKEFKFSENTALIIDLPRKR